MIKLCTMLGAICLATASLADEAPKAAAAPEAKPAAKASKTFVGVTPADIKWTTPPDMPAGVQIALLSGSPKKGAHRAMVKMPGGNKHPLHSHTANLALVMISGTWIVGADEASAKEYGPGSYVFTPGGWQHYSACKDGAECVFYQEASAPFDMIPAAAAPTAK